MGILKCIFGLGGVIYGSIMLALYSDLMEDQSNRLEPLPY